MLACVDVDYRPSGVVAACAAFVDWSAAAPSEECLYCSTAAPEDYRPGQFYRRELPFLLKVLEQLSSKPSCVVIDGYVWLEQGAPGLGAHLYDALGKRSAVIGVAKRAFRDASAAVQVFRGSSRQPLFVTAVGIDANEAASKVRLMHGSHRVPTLLKRVDRLCRDAELGSWRRGTPQNTERDD